MSGRVDASLFNEEESACLATSGVDARDICEHYASSLQEAIADTPPGQRRLVALDTPFGATWQDGRGRDDVVLDQLVADETGIPGAASPSRRCTRRSDA